MKHWISPDITYTAWKKICGAFPDSSPTPKNGNRILWKMLRERTINIFLADSDDPICVTTKQIPRKAILITNPK